VSSEPWAVLFDMDGVLVDSEPVWSVAEAELMAWLGGPWNDEVKAACIGHRIDDACQILVDIAGSSEDPADVVRRLLNRMVELFARDVPWVAGAHELLASLRDAGVPTALVSSSYRVLLDAVLGQLDGASFAASVAGDEVGFPKPDPEPYLAAAAALGVRPARCVVVEDSLTGVRAGVAAGCCVVAVPQPAVDIPALPDRPVLDSLVQVSPELLASELRSRSVTGRRRARHRCGG
jgi:HAD superfamily hydrolase (TIGR01509 family)